MTISAALSTAMLAAWDARGTPLLVALLSGVPTTTAGVFNISGVELSGSGYARATLATADLGVAAGTWPVSRVNTADVVFAPNSGTEPWQQVGFVALLNSTGSQVLTVAALAGWVTIGPHESAVISAGGLVVSV